MGPHSPTRIGLPAKRAAPPVRDGIDTPAGTVPPFRERAPWFGGDLQTLRNIVRGTPPDLPGGDRLLLSMPDGDRLAAPLARPGGRFGRPPAAVNARRRPAGCSARPAGRPLCRTAHRSGPWPRRH